MKPILAPTLLLIAAPLGAQERLGEVLRIAPGREWTYEGNSRYTAFDGELRHTFRLRFLAYDRTAEGRTSMIVQRRIEPGVSQRAGQEPTQTALNEDLFWFELERDLWKKGDVMGGSFRAHPGTTHLELSPFPPGPIPSEVGSIWRLEPTQFVLFEGRKVHLKRGKNLGGWMPDATDIRWTVEAADGDLVVRGRHIPAGPSADQPTEEGLRYDASYRIDRAAGTVRSLEVRTSAGGASFQLSLRLLDTTEVTPEELEARCAEAETWRKLFCGLEGDTSESWEVRLARARHEVEPTVRRFTPPRFPKAKGLFLESLDAGEVGGSYMVRLMATENRLLGQAAPGFFGNDLEGRFLDVSDLRGQVAILSFCSAAPDGCRAQSLLLSALTSRWEKKGLAVVGVWPDDRATSRAAARGDGVAYPVLPSMSETFRRYGIENPGWALFLDRKGIVRVLRSSVVRLGENPEPWHRVIEALIEERDPPTNLPAAFKRP